MSWPQQIERVLPGMCGLSPIHARWIYTSADPLVLVMRIYTLHGPLDWAIGRDLLRDGLNAGQAGEMDVVVEVDESTNSAIIALTTPTGHGKLAFDACDLSDLLDATGRIVPFGAEFVGAGPRWDAWLREVVGA